MDNVLQKLKDIVGSKPVEPTYDPTDLLEKGQHLPSYDDINTAHKVFIDVLDTSHPKAVEMLIAAEKMKDMLEQFRLDRDALAEMQDAIGITLGCAQMLAEETKAAETPDEQVEATQKHFYNLLTCLTNLSQTHAKYALRVFDMGPYKA